MRRELVTSPTVEPVTLEEVKVFARIDCNDDDSLLIDSIARARQFAEAHTKRRFASQTWKMVLDKSDLTSCLEVEKFKVDSITSITVYDEDDASTLVPSSEYSLYFNKIVFDLSVYEYRKFDSMEIVYDIGASETPELVKRSILQIVATWYEHRESISMEGQIDIVPASVLANLASEKIYVA